MKVFVSYSGQTATSPYFDVFCSLLQQALVRLTGLKHMEHVLSDTELGQGDQWPQKLQAKLNQADVLLALYSPLYFSSVACGRELGFFMQRLPVEGNAESIPVLPLWWSGRRDKDVEGFSKPPQSGDTRIDTLQHRSKDSGLHGRFSFNDIEREGLDQFLINEAHVDYKPAVTAYFNLLASRLDHLYTAHQGHLLPNPGLFLEAVDAWAAARDVKPPAPALVPAQPVLSALRNSLFSVPAPQVPPSAPASTSTSGGARVHFLVVAAKPEEIATSPGMDVGGVEAYRLAGGKDWRPFWPTDGYIGYWLQRIVQRNFDGCEANVLVESDPDRALALALEIDRECQPLFFIVDAWTSCIEPHRKLVQELSIRNLPNCAVVVPFVAASKHPAVLDQLHDLLAQREELEDPLCKTYLAVNEAELEGHIAALHERMRQKFRSRAARAGNRRNLSPFSSGAKPELAGVAIEQQLGGAP